MFVVYFINLDNDLNVSKTPFALVKTLEGVQLFCKHNMFFTYDKADLQKLPHSLPILNIDSNQFIWNFELNQVP